MRNKCILIGLGNPIMGDDQLGLIVAERVHKHLPGFDLELSCYNPLDVVDRISGYDKAVLIDSMVTGSFDPGTVKRVELDDNCTLHCSTSHGLDLARALRMARACGACLPSEIQIYGIEVKNPFTVGEGLCAELTGMLDAIVDTIVRDMSRGENCTN